MSVRKAACICGKLTATCSGAPVRVSVCHCLDCQRRSGSSFAAQARWPDDNVTIAGERRSWERTSDTGSRATFYFCPNCGGTIGYQVDSMPGVTAIPIGTFADPAFRQPDYSVFETRKHGWIEVTGEGVEHFE